MTPFESWFYAIGIVTVFVGGAYLLARFTNLIADIYWKRRDARNRNMAHKMNYFERRKYRGR